jgi:ABC-type sugar transport system substrate-binding protein
MIIMKKIKSWSMIFALVTMIVCGAAAAFAAEPVTIAVSIRSMSNEYHMQYVAGAQSFVDSLPEGAAKVQILPCEADDNKQINDIKTLVTSNSNVVLLVDPNNAPNVTSIAEACEEAGVYWVNFWNTPEGITPLSYKYWVHHQTLDGEAQGYDIAVSLFKSFKTPGKGKILVMQGMMANTANEERVKGLKRALAEYPDIEVLDDQSANWDTNEGLALMETWLAKYGDIDGVWSASDGMSLGVVQALKAVGLEGKVAVTGVDGFKDAVDAVGAGTMTNTYVNNGWLQGGYGAAWAYAAYTGQIKVDELDAGHRMFFTEGYLVTKDTYADYIKNFVDNPPVYDYTNLDFCIKGPMPQ